MVTSLAACGSAQVEVPASVDALAHHCYRLVLQDNPAQPLTMEAPISMEDGTVLVQWQVSETDYGSCQVDSTGNVMMITRTAPPDPLSAPPDGGPAAAPVSQPAEQSADE